MNFAFKKISQIMEKSMEISTQQKFRDLLDKSITAREIIFIIALVVCLMPFVSPPVALLIGFAMAQIIGHPFLHLNHKATSLLLKVSVVGLGFGMNVQRAVYAVKKVSGLLLRLSPVRLL